MSTTYHDINAFLFWTKIQQPDPGYNPNKLPLDKLDPKESKYKVTAVVSKEDYNKFVAEFPKNKSTPLENDEFMKKMQVDSVPFPNQPLQYIITFKQKVYKNNGELMPATMRPRVYELVNKEQVDITETKLVGNGSKGIVKYAVWNKSDTERYVSLAAVLVTDLIEYIAPEKNDPTAFKV